MNYQKHELDFQIHGMILDNALEQYSRVVKIPKYALAQESMMSGALSGLGSIFSGLGDSLKQFVSSKIDTSSATGFLGTLADILVPGALWSSHPLLAGIASVAQEIGFPLHEILGKVWEYVKSAFESGQTPDINKALSFIPKTSSKKESFDIIRRACSDNTFIKLAASDALTSYAYNYGGKEEGSVWSWIGKFLKKILMINDEEDEAKKRYKGYGKDDDEGFSFSTLLGWIVKGILLAAFTSWGVGKLKGQMPGASESGASTSSTTPAPSGLSPSGWGESLHNQPGQKWMIEVPQGQNLSNLVFSWIKNVYGQDLQKHKDLIINSASFQNIINILTQAQSDSSVKNLMSAKKNLEGYYIIIPEQFKSIKQIVNEALKDAMSKK